MVSRHHLLAWRKLPQASSAVCAGASPPRRRAAEFDLAAYADVAEMRLTGRPDALDIATPPDTHAAQARLRRARGPYPPETDDPELAEIERLVADVGDRVRFMVHENWRFRPSTARRPPGWPRPRRPGTRVPDDRAQLGAGRPRPCRRAVRGRAPASSPGSNASSSWRCSSTTSTPCAALARAAARVTAAALARVSPEIRGEDVAHISLVADSGAPGLVAGNFSAAGFPPLPSDRLELVGERATIRFEAGVLSLSGPADETIRYDFERMVQESYDNAIAHFVDCPEGGKPFETDRIDNLNTLRLVADAYRLAGPGPTT
ncbi:MAG: hypothetical protein MZU95_04760 [Desulfomicrobium escambiense]|nr:hypothetical protein [Desulfomicrobium escambiense]